MAAVWNIDHSVQVYRCFKAASGEKTLVSSEAASGEVMVCSRAASVEVMVCSKAVDLVCFRVVSCEKACFKAASGEEDYTHYVYICVCKKVQNLMKMKIMFTYYFILFYIAKELGLVHFMVPVDFYLQTVLDTGLLVVVQTLPTQQLGPL